MLVGGIAITFTALLYSIHIIRYPELMPWKVNSCGKGKSLVMAPLSFVNILHHFLTL
jgi:hypothetical protein